MLPLLYALAAYIPAYANECRPWQASDANDPSLVIGKIEVLAGDVFDPNNPAENHRIHRVVNFLHVSTREDIIRQQLLFDEGDRLNLRKLEETARKLRANQYIKDAFVNPVQVCGNKVDIQVRTTDNWTLTAGVSYGRSGGKSTSGFEIQEHNLAGFGKDLVLGYHKEIDRTETLLEYRDPQFGGTHKFLSLMAKSNSDGEAYGVNFTLPFYELDSRNSWGVSANTKTQETPIYQAGNVAYKLGEKLQEGEIFRGWSNGLHNGIVKRYKAGWTYSNRDYFQVDPVSIPSPISQSYPWLEYEYLQDKYIKRTNFQTMGVVEDIALGHHLVLRTGFLSDALGSDDNYLRLYGSYSRGLEIGTRQLGLLDISGTAYFGNGPLEGGRGSATLQWFWFHHPKHTFTISSRLDAASNLQPGEQLTLGGDNGLRGYPDRYQEGNRSILFTAEERILFDWYPYRLLKFGAAFFADAGSAWGQGNKINMLADVGFGLRLVSTRSSGKGVIHIDFAFPVNAPSSVDSFQILITTRNSL